MTRIIKKYPNRRLYDTETSAYITLAEVKQFVLEQQQFEVHDARTNEDLTRSILLQIILEEEGSGAPMFSADMLSNIIRYYGHTMQGLMGNYLERSIGAFHEAQHHFQEQSKSLYGAKPGAAGNFAPGLASSFAPDAWTKLAQNVPSAVPTMMNDYLEKSASGVIGMQEELRKQAMQMFSAFPYAGMTGMPDIKTHGVAGSDVTDTTDTKESAKTTRPDAAGKPASKRKKAESKKPSNAPPAVNARKPADRQAK